MKPDRNKVDNMKDANYDKLSEEGYCKVETVIKDGDVIIGMVNPKPTTKEDEKPYKDNSMIYKSIIPGAIDKVITGLIVMDILLSKLGLDQNVFHKLVISSQVEQVNFLA